MYKTMRNMDWVLFGSMIGLVALGLFSLHLVSDQTHPQLWQKVASFIVAGLIGFVLFCFVPVKYVRFASGPLYAVILLLMVLVWRIGWKVDLGVFELQYAGIMQWPLLLVLARYLGEGDVRDWKSIGIAILLVAVPLVVVRQQFDVVTMMALMLIIFVAAIAAAQWRVLAVAMISLMLLLPGFWFLQHPYAKERITRWLFEPSATVQYGYDFLKSTGDFRVVLIGLAIVMAALLIWRMMIVTRRSQNRFAFTLSASITFMASLYLIQEIALLSSSDFIVEKLVFFIVSYDGLAWAGLMAAIGVVMRVAIESRYRVA